ncbi:MAG: toast rack family protein [Bacteroidales bacterium]|nr:toast rack family protein [Bacteroidales bacterium]
MKLLNFLLTLTLLVFLAFSCDEQQSDEDQFVEDGIENQDADKELVTTDFNELEEKMEEIMYENDESDSEIKKDVVVIKSKGAREVHIDLKIAAGKLKLTGGASELLTGGFIYSNQEWKPEVKYNIKDKKGFLQIKQPNNEDYNINDDDKYVWNLKFNDEIPLDFDVNLGAGVSEILLSGMNIRHFNMVMGVGKTEIDLRGKWKHSADIHLDGGIGLSQIYLPDNVGVMLNVTKGLGGIEVKNLIKKGNSEYVNKAYENSGIVLKIYLKTGIGKIEVE